MIAAFLIIIASLTGLAVYHDWHEKKCDHAWQQVDRCRDSHDFNSCKRIYIDKDCEIEGEDTE